MGAYNGVIVADVVGLGKTVIACLIARLRGLRGIKHMKSAVKRKEVCEMLDKLGIALKPDEGNFKKIKKELGKRAAELACFMRAV